MKVKQYNKMGGHQYFDRSPNYKSYRQLNDYEGDSVSTQDCGCITTELSESHEKKLLDNL